MPIPVWDVLTTTRREDRNKRSYYLMWYDRQQFKGSRDEVIAEVQEMVRVGKMNNTRGQVLINSLRGK